MADLRHLVLQGLLDASPRFGLAPYGLRHGSPSPKGKGYFGLLPNADGGVSTEISAEDGQGEFPLIVPTLTKDELQLLLRNEDPTDDIYRKAEMWAAARRQQGRDPFATPADLRFPVGLLFQ